MEIWVRFHDAAIPPQMRSIRQFAEQEVVLPTGPFEGYRFSAARQPVHGLILDEYDSGRWTRFALTGPAQSGKSLIAFIIVLMYYLFEVKCDVILGIPDGNLAADKWRDDILPVIEKSRYASLLPKRGAGSKGGKSLAVKFGNGRVLRFMTGNSKGIRSKTAMVDINTEIDQMQKALGKSKESDPLRMLEARTNAFGNAARVFNECTVTTEDGRICVEIKNGSNSRVEVECPHCREWVTFEREHFVGWQDAKTIREAEQKARLVCPKCGAMLNEEQRRRAHNKIRLVHGNPEAKTLGVRYNVANNLLMPLSKLAEKEWTAQRMGDDEGERDLRQNHWAIPAETEKVELTVSDWTLIAQRQGIWTKGIVPEDCEFITLAADVGKYLLHWVAIAWRPNATPHVLDYGVVEVYSGQMEEKAAIANALSRLRDEVAIKGWAGQRPRRVFVDAGDWPDVVEPWCTATHAIWPGVFWPCKGFGEKQVSQSGEVAVNGWSAVQRQDGTIAVNLLADRWKSRVYAGIECPTTVPGAMTLFKVDKTQEHLSFGKQLTAEKKVEQTVNGKIRTLWVRVRRANHYLDSIAMAIAAGVTWMQQMGAGGTGGQQGNPGGGPVGGQQQPQDQEQLQSSGWVNEYKDRY